jgi:hypothetical protein
MEEVAGPVAKLKHVSQRSVVCGSSGALVNEMP